MHINGVSNAYFLISSPEHKVLQVSFCDGPLSVVHRQCVRPSVRASTISLDDISFKTAYLILTKFHKNDPLVVPYQSCSNRSSWLHKKVTGSKYRFSKCNFQKYFVRKYKAQSFHIWYIASSRVPLPKLVKLCPWGQN